MEQWSKHLERWTAAGIVDEETAVRIREWEAAHASKDGYRWPTLIALTFGAVLLGAGVLLFVAAHWLSLSETTRVTLLIAVVAALHAGGAFSARRFPPLSVALHAVATVALGGAIFLIVDTYHLRSYEPTAMLVWASGAAIAWAILRQWPQGAMTAILAPWWICAEWVVKTAGSGPRNAVPIFALACALSLVYLAAPRTSRDSAMRRALMWIGGIALIPFAAALGVVPDWRPVDARDAIAVAVAIGGPLAVAAWLHGRNVLPSAVAILWAFLLALIGGSSNDLAVYGWLTVGSLGLIGWGVLEDRTERINLGIAGFGLTVISFYFSSVMDKLDRSASLIGLGMLFLGGGWLLERTRRRLVAQVRAV